MRIEQGPELGLRPAESAGAELSSGLTPGAAGSAGKGGIGGIGGIGGGTAVDPTGGTDFGAILEQQVADASRLQKLATAKTEALARGASDDLHGTMISMKEAEISMKLVGSVRNRLLDAFHELWRINL